MHAIPTTRAELARSVRMVLETPAAHETGSLAAFAVTYAAAYIYGNHLPELAPLWPPDAVLLCALLLTTPRRWGACC